MVIESVYVIELFSDFKRSRWPGDNSMFEINLLRTPALFLEAVAIQRHID